jgi:hypothetical protein
MLLRPEWERPGQWLPALAHYIATTPADSDNCLRIDASGGELPLDVVEAVLTQATEALSGGRPFADVLVVTEPAKDEPGPAPDLGPPPGGDPAALVEQARAVKRLADELRGIVERHRFEASPSPWCDARPLVSVRIATWNGHGALVDRTLPSVLNGDYPNVEVVVCSDGPDPAARAAVEAVPDERIRFLELDERPAYPLAGKNLWRVGGTEAVNTALDHCRGSFIAPLDHDDSFTANHVSALLAHAARERADFVWGQALCELGTGPWVINGSPELSYGALAHGSVLYSSRLAHMRYDGDGWLFGEPGDWNMWRRMRDVGAATAHLPAPVLVHFRERTSIGAEAAAPPEPTDAELLADLLATGARWLLSVPLPAPALV